VFGGTIAAPIWHAFMVKAMQGWPVEGFESPPPPESGQIPNVVGLAIEEAEEILVEANFSPVVEEVLSFEEKGLVLTQAPAGGTARLGSLVTLTVSNGKGEPVVVPRVVDLPEFQAVKTLRQLGLVADVQYRSVNNPSLDGIVVDQVPIGDGNKLVDVGATVTIFVGEYEPGGGGGGGGGDGNGDGEEPSPSPSPEDEAPQARL
jgi:hypothetical protein